jgi:hypothetical protein
MGVGFDLFIDSGADLSRRRQIEVHLLTPEAA